LQAARSDELVTLYRAASVLLDVGDAADAAQVGARLTRGPSAPGMRARLLDGLLRAEGLRLRGKPKEAAEALLRTRADVMDAWLLCLGLGRAYLDAGAFADAVRELEACQARRGEGATAFLPDTVTLGVLPPVLYHLALAQEGLHSHDAVTAYRALLALEPAPQGDPLATDAQRRLAALR
jgi:hypothetical protein